MNKSLNKALREMHGRGVSSGSALMALITLISAENVCPDYMENEQIGPFLRDLERDIQQVYAEAVAAGTDPQAVREMTERLLAYCEEIRARRGMDKLQEGGTNDAT